MNFIKYLLNKILNLKNICYSVCDVMFNCVYNFVALR